MDIYKWKWMVLGALGYMNNADFDTKKVNENKCARCLLFVRNYDTYK